MTTRNRASMALASLGPALAVCASFLAGCVSLPKPVPLTEAERASLSAIASTDRGAAIGDCVGVEEPWLGQGCAHLKRELAQLLKRTELFSDVRESGDEGRKDDFLVRVLPTARPSFNDSPGIVVVYLASLVVPVWRTDTVGYYFYIEDPLTKRFAKVDTRRKETTILWSLAPLVNKLWDRTAVEDKSVELDRIKAQLAPVLGGPDARRSAPADPPRPAGSARS